MRRRVSREQLLDASQSILSPRGNPRWRGGGSLTTCLLCASSQTVRKGIRLKFRNLAAEPLALWVASPRRRQFAAVARFVAVTRQNPETPAVGPGRVFFSPNAAEALETSWRERGFWQREERRQHGAASGFLPSGP